MGLQVHLLNKSEMRLLLMLQWTLRAWGPASRGIHNVWLSNQMTWQRNANFFTCISRITNLGGGNNTTWPDICCGFCPTLLRGVIQQFFLWWCWWAAIPVTRRTSPKTQNIKPKNLFFFVASKKAKLDLWLWISTVLLNKYWNLL